MVKMRTWKTFLILSTILLLVPYHSFATSKSDHTDVIEEVHNRQIIVQVENGKIFNYENYGVEKVETSGILEERNFITVHVPEEYNYDKVLSVIQMADEVVFAEPNYIRTSTFVPSDAGYYQQWYLDRINMPKAWDIEMGSEQVKIAVLDTGVNANHPDLMGRVLPGYDFVNEDADPSDDHWHGTFVAGIIAANMNNNLGIAGIDANAKILPVKVADSNGNLTVTDIIEGIYYAIEQNADVINMSFTSYNTSKIEEQAIQEAYKAGIVLVAATGNDKKAMVGYPAAYPTVISVGATNRYDHIASFSNYGILLDIVAPGEEIYSTHYTGGYGKGDGTSFAAPIVSAIAGLLKAKNPEWTNYEIEWALQAGANSISGSEWNQQFGYGIVDAYNSLSLHLPKWDDASNSKTKATALLDSKTEEAIDYPTDVDWYSFEVEAGADVSINILNRNSTNDLIANVHFPNGSYYTIDHGFIGENETYTFKGSAGTYYIEIFDKYNHWSETPFELEVTGMKKPVQQEQIFNTKFKDVTLYEKEISYLTELGIIRGYPDGTFKPSKPVTRLQAIQMIMNQMGIDYENAEVINPNFSDVSPNSYGYKAIAKAVELGIVKGRMDGTFNPGGTLTRWEMATILVNAYKLNGSFDGEFVDVPKSHFAYDAITKLAASKVTKGYEDNTFRPNNTVSRAHFSVFLYNYLVH